MNLDATSITLRNILVNGHSRAGSVDIASEEKPYGSPPGAAVMAGR